MKNVYHGDIMQLLMLKGKEGMHVTQVSRMVYNLHANLFDKHLNFNELHQTIRNYLWRQSQMRRSPIMRINYGVYAIKPDIAIQLDISFDTPIDEENIEKQPQQEKEQPNEDPRQLLLF